MSYNAMREEFDLVTFQGKPALFSDFRIDKSTVPKGVVRYEIRHADENWDKPCQLAYGILVNHYGTLLMTEPVQLPPDGKLDFEPEALNFSSERSMKLNAFMKKYPPIEKTVFEIVVAEKEQADLFYSSNEKDTERGCVGYVRGDMGSGKEFWTTWHPHQEQLCVQPFKGELNNVVSWLRQRYGPLHDLDSMRSFCTLRDSASLGDDRSYGFRIETPKYEYMLRCSPARGDYNFYLLCYDKVAREQYRSTPEQKLSLVDQLKDKFPQPKTSQQNQLNKPPKKDKGLNR